MGIILRLPVAFSLYDYDIYRSEDGGEFECIQSLTNAYRSYCDSDLKPDSSYTYFFIATALDKRVYPNSERASIVWTDHSDISNLKVWQDKEDIRTIHVEWDDVTDAEYDINVSFVAPGNRDENWHWSGLPYNTHDMELTWALPGTGYVVTVTEPITQKQLSKTITLPKARKYSQYGSTSKGGKLLWISKADLYSNDKDPWDSKNIAYKAVSPEDFKQKTKDYVLYYQSKFTYTKASDNHEVDEMIIIRMPSGRIVYDDMYETYIEAKKKNWTWSWYLSLGNLLYDLNNSYTLDPGTYTIEHYFDDRLVNSSSFKINN